MKSTLQLLIGLSILFTSTSCQSAYNDTLRKLRETQFPTFEEIYTHVNKQITSPGEGCQFGLAKTADGYYLKITPYKENKFQAPKFVKAWSAESKKYLTLQIDEYLSGSYSSEPYTGGLESVRFQEQQFNLSYLYGYPNFTSELIELLNDQEDLSSKELEMLARAYSNEACDYIHPNQTGIEITATKDLSNPGYEKIAESRISSFLKLAEKSLACYRKIEKQYPAYKTIIFDNLSLKINHDIMNYYHILSSVKETELAKGMLKTAHYENGAIEYAKELLVNCAENGVLITSGDSDTFPLWYVQEVLNYRKDVIVINYSLLQAPWYFDFIKNTTSIKSTLSTKEYEFYSRSYVIMNTAEKAITYEEWMNELKLSKTPNPDKVDEMQTWEDMPKSSNKFKLNIQGTPVNFAVNQGYLLGVDICFFDLIYANEDRTFYSSSPASFFNSPLKNHLVKRNLIYELTSAEIDRFSDKQTVSYLDQAIRANRINYNSSNHLLTENILCSRLFDWAYLEQDQIEANKSVFQLFIKQINIQKYLDRNDYEFIQAYTAALWTMDQKKAQIFMDSYAGKALESIESVDNQKICSEKDAERLKIIFEVYYRRPTTGSTDPGIESALDKKVILSLKDKVNTLCDNPLNTRNLSWTLDILKHIKEELKYR
nr:hypothetical protein [uncultured Fluviicola sp.]